MLAGGLPRPVLFSRYRTKGRISFGSFGKGKGLPHCNSEAPIILSPARLPVPPQRLYERRSRRRRECPLQTAVLGLLPCSNVGSAGLRSLAGCCVNSSQWALCDGVPQTSFAPPVIGWRRFSGFQT